MTVTHTTKRPSTTIAQRKALVGKIIDQRHLPTVHLDSPSKARVTIDGVTKTIVNLLGDGDSNTKLSKSKGYGYETRGLSLVPHRMGGIGNVCPFASDGCIDGCLVNTGLAGVWASVNWGRLARRMIWHQERGWFLERLHAEISNAERKAKSVGNRLAVRLNVFSDLPWESFGIMQEFPTVEFYDYTKNPGRVGQVLPNYWTTFSKSEINADLVLEKLREASNVAVVFQNPGKFSGNRSAFQALPKTWEGYSVVDGDTTDLRFTDPRGRKRGRVIGLRLKAGSNADRQKSIDSGFAVEHLPTSRQLRDRKKQVLAGRTGN